MSLHTGARGENVLALAGHGTVPALNYLMSLAVGIRDG